MRFKAHTRSDEVFCIKGALLAQVNLPGIGFIDVANSHLGAVTFNARKNAYNPTQLDARYAQAQQLGSWLKEHQQNPLLIACLDLNAHYHAYKNGYNGTPGREYDLFTSNSGGLNLRDSYRAIHGINDPPHWTIRGENPYVSRGFFEGAPSQVVDYIFVSPHERYRVASAQRVFEETFMAAGKEITLSDHCGIVTEIAIKS